MQQKGLDFEGSAEPRPARRRALTVSELTDRIRGVFETEFLDVWVEGEISNLKRATSGHVYFSLKDADAQIAATVWKSDARRLRFRPEDGMHVLARGSIRVHRAAAPPPLVGAGRQLLAASSERSTTSAHVRSSAPHRR